MGASKSLRVALTKTEMSAAHPIVAYLTALRTTVRRRLFAYGVCAVLAGGVVALLAILLLDWFLWLPSFLRLTGVVLFVAGFFLAVLHWVVHPLQARIGPNELAARLERQFSGFHDQLSSTVRFLDDDTPVSQAMKRRVIADTEKMLGRIPLDTALSMRPVAVRAGVFGVAMFFLLGASAIAPSWLRTGISRYADPFGPVEWPRSTEIRPLTHDQTVALGESAVVRMAIDRGLHDDLRGVVCLRSHDGQVQRLAMQRDADGAFATTIDAIAEELTYWFEAGDDDTRRAPATLRVIKRPEVIEAIAAVEPPPYAVSRVPKVVDLTQSAASAPVGGFVTITLRATKPIVATDEPGKVGLRDEEGTSIPLVPDAGDARLLSARFGVTKDLLLRPELIDDAGFSNRNAAAYSIHAVSDAPPTITLLEPASLVEVTPVGSLRVSARVEDDFGIRGIELRAEGFRDGRSSTIPLRDRLLVTRQDDGIEGVVTHLWEFEPLGLLAGDVLSCEWIAEDNFLDAGGNGQVGRSATFRVKMVSQSELEIRLREDITALEARLRRLVIDQAGLNDRTAALTPSSEAPTPLTEAERDESLALSAAESRAVQQLRDIAARLQGSVASMRLNHVGADEDAGRLQSAVDELRRVAAESLTDASLRLGAAHERSTADEQRREIQASAAAQLDALERLNAVLRNMSSWGAFQGLVARSRDLLDRQNAVRAQTADVASASLGKPVESLTPAELAALKRVERQQDRLADDLERHLASLDQVAAATREKDPAGAGAIDDALRAARANEAQKHAQSAVEAIQSNRTAAATLEQRAAADAIRKMIAALRERDERELAELRKKLENAEELVADLLQQEQGIKLATHEAGAVGADQPAFNGLSEQQRTLARNTRMLSEDIAQIGKAMSASRHVRLAADPMGRAEIELAARQAAVAEPAQDQAIAHLEDALADLQALVQADADDAFRRTLSHIQEELQAVLDGQRPITEGVAKLRTAIPADGRLGRAETREASKLSKLQLEVQQVLTEALPAFQKAPVYEWALQRVVKWMDSTRTSLDDRRIDDELVSTTARIVGELEKLITALDETRAMPGITEFAEAESGADGGGSGESDDSAALSLPTVAELLVLRAMQTDINARTARFDEGFVAQDATEAQLRQLTILGEDQGEVRRLAERLVEKARGGP